MNIVSGSTIRSAPRNSVNTRRNRLNLSTRPSSRSQKWKKSQTSKPTPSTVNGSKTESSSVRRKLNSANYRRKSSSGKESMMCHDSHLKNHSCLRHRWKRHCVGKLRESPPKRTLNSSILSLPRIQTSSIRNQLLKRTRTGDSSIMRLHQQDIPKPSLSLL